MAWPIRLQSFTILSMILLAIAGFSLLSGCSDSGGNDSGSDPSNGLDTGNLSITALSLPDRIELTKVEDGSTGPAAYLHALGTAGRAFNDPGTDYTGLQKRSWTEDMADALVLVNEILDVVNDTGYSHMVNEGPYVALVNTPGDDGENQNQGGGATGASNSEQLAEMIVDVLRDDNESPMYVKFWLDEENGPGDMPQRIKGRFEVTEGVSETYPMGMMTAYIMGTPLVDGEESGEPSMKIAMDISSENGQAIVEFVEFDTFSEQGFDLEMNSAMRVVADADFVTGVAFISEREPDWDSHMTWETDGVQYEDYDMLVAFDNDYVKVEEDGEIAVFDKNELDHEVHRYKVFDSDGNSVDLTSGFPIRFKDTSIFGYVGYYGMWAPENAPGEDGTRVIREGTEEEYEVVQKPGKLIKHARQTIALEKLDGVELSYYNGESGSDYVITWNGVSDFLIIGYRNEDTNWNTQYYENTHELYHAVVELNEWDGAWCDSLQTWLPLGQLFVGGITPSNATILTFHAQKTMVPGTDTFPTTLYHFGPGINENDWEYDWENAAVSIYTYDTANLVLRDEDGNIVQYTGQDWGRELMPMTTQEVQDPWTEDVYYSWMSGNDEWCRLTVLRDPMTEEYLAFDAPLRMTYTHETGFDWNFDAADPNDGRIFSLEFDGFEVQMPWIYDPEEDEYMPLLNLRDSHDSGIQLTGEDGNTYLIKGWEEELIMAKVPEAEWDAAIHALALPTPEEIGQPSIGDTMDVEMETIFGDTAAWVLPANVAVAVIKGELVGGDAE
jgi:hypothetical protein